MTEFFCTGCADKSDEAESLCVGCLGVRTCDVCGRKVDCQKEGYHVFRDGAKARLKAKEVQTASHNNDTFSIEIASENIVKKITFLVAINADGEFFGLNESFSTTSPLKCEHPYDAKKIYPYDNKDLDNPKEPSYYFENSDRMKRWLNGYKMTKCTMVVIATTPNETAKVY